MRRAANLFDQIADRDNLRIAFHKAARGRRGQAMVRQFAASLDRHIAAMSEAIRGGTFQVGRFQQFLIRDPKERVITAPCFDERVLHHAIMNVCEPVMDRWLIDDTFACRTGKGREAAIERAQHFTRNATWFLKLDVRKYFDSVPHAKLMDFLERRFKDRRLLELLNRIIAAYRGEPGIGLPIGSLTSQHFANFYLGWLDRFVKESLRVRGYVRYMDDMLLWHESREALIEIHGRCQKFAATQLALDFKLGEVQRTGAGVPFLGCRIWPTHVELNRRSKRRWRNRVRVLERAERLGLSSELELQTRLTALTAFAKGAGVKSWRFRQSVLKQVAVDDP
ncbi:MAG: reverse transcriptase/maturase family protein [Planctomycetota bacterium]|nr:reverse transcriptase/maturase family protein [Planctomycetota bacterium]